LVVEPARVVEIYNLYTELHDLCVSSPTLADVISYKFDHLLGVSLLACVHDIDDLTQDMAKELLVKFKTPSCSVNQLMEVVEKYPASAVPLVLGRMISRTKVSFRPQTCPQWIKFVQYYSRKLPSDCT